MKKLLLFNVLLLVASLSYSMEENKEIDPSKPLLEQLEGLGGTDRKDCIAFWCDAFKGKLSKIEKESCNIRNGFEWITIEYYELLYAKKMKAHSHELNDTDNKEYIDTLLMLEATKNFMKRDLNNVSWFQRLWNYGVYQNYQKSTQTLDEEIALFKDQDKVVSPEKTVNTSSSTETIVNELTGQIKIDAQITGSYLKPQLTRRDVFTRSRMPRSRFEQVKTARE